MTSMHRWPIFRSSFSSSPSVPTRNGNSWPGLAPWSSRLPFSLSTSVPALWQEGSPANDRRNRRTSRDRYRYAEAEGLDRESGVLLRRYQGAEGYHSAAARSEEHTSELQSLMRISSAVFCLKKKNQ